MIKRVRRLGAAATLALSLSALAAAVAVVPSSEAAPVATTRATPTSAVPKHVQGEMPVNRWAGPVGTSSMHGDPGASDTTPYTGPGDTPSTVQTVTLPAVCPTILAGSDGMPVALCTEYADRAPSAYLLDPTTDEPLARLHLTKGSTLGGVYAYVDNRNRLVTVDGSGAVVRIAHDRKGPDGTWRLYIQSSFPFRAALTRLCGSATCDSLVSVAPGYDGRIWFVTQHAGVGYVDPRTKQVVVKRLGVGEQVANSIATAPGGVLVTTDHALYTVTVDKSGAIHTLWRHAYNRGPARKPGQLSWGSGSTPTYFGPRTGHEFVTILDNARPRSHLLVYRASTGRLRCDLPVLHDDDSGSENSPIGWRRSVYVASTYGYSYPAGTTGKAEPASAPFVGGFERIDLTAHGCEPVWTTMLPSAGVPRLSVAENAIYTVERNGEQFSLARLSAATGRVLHTSPIGVGPTADTIQMVGTILPDGTLLQGDLTGYTVTRSGR